MRAIDLDTLEIKDFLPPGTKYAILSHVWAETEVTFEDYKQQRPIWNAIRAEVDHQSPADLSSGVSKLAGAIRLCRQLRYRYLWSDTCCINKESSAELSESINSMFTWYQEADICIAYLVDVGEYALAFTQSKWFKRGWTLQELLAPRRITFYDQLWHAMGTKESLSAEIESATRVSSDHLQNFRSASIATKFSWLADRTTTRPEDIAYSMFGVFDVAMDIRYGERGERAFRRLQEQIVNKYIDDESILAWTSHASGPGGVLAPSPQCFRDCASLVVSGQIGTYRPRQDYRISGRGFEITAPTSRRSRAIGFRRGPGAFIGSISPKFDLTLNCWDLRKQSASTVVIQLERNERGVYQRTNRQRLEWAENTRRLKNSIVLSLLRGPTAMSLPIVLEL